MNNREKNYDDFAPTNFLRMTEKQEDKLKPLIKTTLLEAEAKVKSRNSLLGVLMLFACILIGMAGLLFCLLDSFKFETVNYFGVFIQIFAILLIFTVLYFLPSKIFTSAGFLVAAGGIAFYVYSNLQKIIDSVYYTINLCFYKISQEGYVLGSIIDYSLARSDDPKNAEYINLTVLIIATVFTLLISYIVYSRKNVLFALCISLVMIFPGFFYGLIPSYFSFILVIAFWFACFAIFIFDTDNIGNLIEKQNKGPEKKREKYKYITFKKQYFAKINKIKKDIKFILKSPNRDENTIPLQKLVIELEKLTDREKLFLRFNGLLKPEKNKKNILTEINNTAASASPNQKNVKNVKKPVKKKHLTFISPLEQEKARIKREQRAKKDQLMRAAKLEKSKKDTRSFKVKAAERLSANFNSKIKITAKNGYSGFFALLLAVITLFIVQPLISPKATLKMSLPKDVQEFAESTISYFFVGSNANVYGGYNGGMGGGYLYNKNGAQFENKPILKISAINEGVMYLKGWVGNVYDGKMWQEADRKQTEAYKTLNDEVLKKILKSNESQFFYLFTDNMQKITGASYQKKYAELKVENITIQHLVTGGKLSFLPYFYTTYSSSNSAYQFKFKKESDLKISVTNSFMRKPEYSVEFYRVDNVLDRQETPVFDMRNYLNYYNFQYESNMDSSIFIENEDEGSIIKTNFHNKNFYEAELEYYDYVNQYYLETPDGLPPEIRELALEITKNSMTDYDKALAIENYLAVNNTYTLYPRAPKDPTKDFVYNFLFDTNEGYCTYYATAMVIMMRSIGIPARYVEGYLVDAGNKMRDLNDGKMYHIVYDYNGHAWPEIYLRGAGWLPFEPTTAISDEASGETPYTYTPPSRIPGYDSMNMSTYSEFLEEDIEIKVVNELGTPVVKIFLITAFTLMIILIFNLVNYITLENRLNYFKNAKTKDAVIKMLEYSLRFFRLCGYTMYNDEGIVSFSKRITRNFDIMQGINFAGVSHIIEKAKYSGHELCEEERLSVYDFIIVMRSKALFNLKFSRKIKLKYYYFII